MTSAFITSLPLISRNFSPLPSHTSRPFFQTPLAPAMSPRRSPLLSLNVLVTGAAGRTGRLVLSTLLSNPSHYTAKGVVRSIDRATETTNLPEQAFIQADITKKETLQSAFSSMDALVILTSAVPKPNPRPEGSTDPLTFFYVEGGMPEQVDWHGARNQIDLAKECGVKHVIIVGSMGSTDDANPLNRVGNGNILRFKRMAEMYLIESGLNYTVINPSGLINEPGEERELVLGRADELFTVFSRKEMAIPRADVARVVVAALGESNARNKAFDVCARPKGIGKITTDFADLFESAGPHL